MEFKKIRGSEAILYKRFMKTKSRGTGYYKNGVAGGITADQTDLDRRESEWGVLKACRTPQFVVRRCPAPSPTRLCWQCPGVK